MNNEELKKKIANIIDNVFENRCRKTNCQNCDLYPDEMCQPNMYADALIAAGIGDVKEAERCAKVAERALRDRATYCAMEDLDYFSLTTVAVEARAKELYDGWMQQAEKDLAKEKQK